MKKRNDNKKEIPKIKLKKTKNSTVSKQISRREPDLWKEISSKFKQFIKVYRGFREKRKIIKQKEERIKLKEQEEQRLKEREEQRLQDQEERRFKKEQKLKATEAKKLKEEEEKRLEAIRIKEEKQERQRQAQIYKERMAKAERTRLTQLAEATESREKRLKEKKTYDEYIKKREISEPKEGERKLIEERNLMMERKLEKEQKLKEKETQRLKEEDKQKLKEEEEQRSKEGEIRFDDKQKKKRLNGKVKWFSSAKGYGFIEREDEEKDIFVHFSAVKNSGLKYLKEGEQLTFEVEYSDKGTSAINLQKTVNEVSRSHLRVVK